MSLCMIPSNRAFSILFHGSEKWPFQLIYDIFNVIFNENSILQRNGFKSNAQCTYPDEN
jgi:hypothetical protein